MINMGVEQGKISGMNKQEMIDYVLSKDFTTEQRMRLKSHWLTVSGLKQIWRYRK